MTINEAVKYMHFMISNGHWKGTKKTVEAYNAISGFIDDKNKQQFNDNQLFGKLFITFYGKLLQYYQGSIFDKEPQKELNKILDKPIDLIIQEFTSIANDQETFIKMKEAGISDKHKVLKTKEELESEKGKFKMEMLEPVMTEEEATSNLSAMINHALNSYN